MNIKSLTIYCSSSDKLDKDLYQISEKIGKFLAKKSIKIIYGGGQAGIMGKVSNASYNEGGSVIGIIPEFLINKEKINKNIGENIIVKNMTERKLKLHELGDAFLILPGGSGTIEEVTETISWKFLGLHSKEIIFFNYKGYWDQLFFLYEKFKNENFSNKNLQSISKNIRTYEELTKIFL
jgi:uncharacterized protein (TIGR00730 family)